MLLVGENVYLRKINNEDTDMIVRWRNDESIRNRFFYRETFTREIHENWIKTKIETGKVVQFIVCLKDGDIPIGSTYLRDIDKNEDTAEYGVFIGVESARGRGIGKEILGLTLDYAWNVLELSKVRARAISTNEASIQSFLHSGFKKDELVKSVLCSDGSMVDMVMMSISRP